MINKNDDKNNNDLIIKLIKNIKIIKLFVITFLVMEELAQNKLFLTLTKIPKLSTY